MPVGTNLGQSFNQQYGTGSAEILDSSSTVNVARDIYGQEAQWGKVKQAEKRQDRNDADKMINTPVDFWAKDKDVLMPKYNELLDKAARFRSKVDNPFTGYSSDPEVQEFQKEWRNFKSMTAQSALERAEFEKYQAKLFDKNSNALADDSKKQLDEYYSKPISERWGKTPPQMRVKDPTANFFGHASQVAKANERKEFTTQEANEMVDNMTESVPEFKDKNGKLAAEAYQNMKPEQKKAAELEFGTDENGNIDFVNMGKELFKRQFRYATNVQDYDYSKVLTEIGEKAKNVTLKDRDTKGNIIMLLNSGKAAVESKAAIKTLINSRMMSDKKFSNALIADYMPLIDKTGLDKLSEKEKADTIYDRIVARAVDVAFAQKDKSEQDLDAIAPKITINNNNTGEQGAGDEVWNQWVSNAIMAAGKKGSGDWYGETKIAGVDTPEMRLLRGHQLDGRLVDDIRVRQQDEKSGKKGYPYIRVQFRPIGVRDQYNPQKDDFRDYYLDKPEDLQSLKDAVFNAYKEKGSEKKGTHRENYKKETSVPNNSSAQKQSTSQHNYNQ